MAYTPTPEQEELIRTLRKELKDSSERFSKISLKQSKTIRKLREENEVLNSAFNNISENL